MARFPDIGLRNRTLCFPESGERTLIFGILNLTPDSFSDGGRLPDVESALALAQRWVDAGVDVLDVGGESTRPHAARVDADLEAERVLPVIRALAARIDVPISIDTTKARVAAVALAAGAQIVNDISGGRLDPEMVAVVERTKAAFICGHVRGRTLDEVHAGEATPPTFDEVVDELAATVAALPASVRARTIVDPGIGFGKKGRENLALLGRAGEIATRAGRPVMVGPSRKRFLGLLVERPVDDRDDATIGACLAAVAAGAHAVRVHDVKRVRDALTVFEKVRAAVRA